MTPSRSGSFEENTPSVPEFEPQTVQPAVQSLHKLRYAGSCLPIGPKYIYLGVTFRLLSEDGSLVLILS